MLEEVSARLRAQEMGETLLERVIAHLGKIAQGGYKRITNTQVMGDLRIVFARISVDLLQPDFVIMDEFQRFRYLLESDGLSETGAPYKQVFLAVMKCGFYSFPPHPIKCIPPWKKSMNYPWTSIMRNFSM